MQFLLLHQQNTQMKKFHLDKKSVPFFPAAKFPSEPFFSTLILNNIPFAKFVIFSVRNSHLIKDSFKMSPSALPDQEILVDERRQKFIEILKSNGITDEVETIVMINPPELKGEHMGSATVYVRIEFKDASKKPKNLFVKVFFNNKIHIEMFKMMKVMEKETEFFHKFLPSAKDFCKKHNCENLINFFPKCLYGDDEMIVLENVVLDDTFVMLPKEVHQDLYTAKFVLTNLAKFHGATYSMIEETGREEFQKKWSLVFHEGLVSPNNPFIDSLFDNGIAQLLSILKSNSVEGQEEAVSKLKEFIGKSSPAVLKILPAKPEDKIWVVNHGDCWNNNLLFKMDSKSGKVTDQIFVDLQITRIGSPCLDLSYFLYTSVKPPVRRVHLKELLEHYFNEFKNTVELFNRECFCTFEEFFEEYKEKCVFGFFFQLNFMSAIGALKDVDMGAAMENMQDMKAIFETAVINWAAKNPEKARNISTEIVALVKEHLAFTSQ